MPLVFEKKLNGARLGVWQITEPECFLRKLGKAVSGDMAIADSYKNESRRKQWFACRALFGQMLMLDSVKISYDVHGKPSLEGFRGEISISHTQEYAAVLTDDNRPAGIDIEKISPRIERVADRFLREDELAAIRQTAERYRLETCHEAGAPPRYNPYTELLCLYWCSKEALYKFYGRPSVDLKNDIHIISFDYFCNSQATFQARVEIGESVEIHDLEFERIGDHMLVYTIAKLK